MFNKVIFTTICLMQLHSYLQLTLSEPSLPIFWCKFNVNERCCDFNNVFLNETHFLFQPAAENVSAVKKISFNSSYVPVLGDSLCKTFPHLEEFHLRKSKLREIRVSALAGCTVLRSLYLIGNDLETLTEGIFDANLNLEKLYLNINFIRYLPPEIFAPLKRLKILHLQDNKLTNLDPMLFQQNLLLEQLVIHTNDLLEIDEKNLLKFLPELKKIGYNNNLLPCDRVDEIMRRFAEKNVKVHKDFSYRKRFHPQEELYSDLLCLDEMSWMTVHYRRKLMGDVNELSNNCNCVVKEEKCDESLILSL